VLGSAGSDAEIFVRGHVASAGHPSVAIKNLIIGGSVDRGQVYAGLLAGIGNPDAQIGAVRVGGDWIASDLVAGVSAGLDGVYGTSDDAPLTQAGEPDDFFSKIGSITIAGRVAGTAGGSDHFGFVAQEIGAFRVNGVAIKLTSGHSNDTSTTDSHLTIGATGDVTIHEV
jgi:hypothetical protein